MKRLSAVLLAVVTSIPLGCGYTSKTTTPAIAGTAPMIATLTPNTMTSGGTAFVLTVNGTNFSTTASINWSGAAVATTHVSATELTTTIAASDIASSATVPVTVTNPATGGTGAYGSGGTLAATSAPVNFTVN